MSNPIVTDYVFPPIPDRSHDWSAHWDGYEPGDPIGYGRTEQEAIEDLTDNYEEPRRLPDQLDRAEWEQDR